MKKSRIIAVSGIVITLLLLMIGGAWFWSAGSVAAESLPLIRVQAVKGDVEYKTGDTWTVVQNEQEVHAGDRVKTGTDSEAQILWGDEGVTRIDPQTELVIDAAPTDGSGSQSAVIRLQVNAGRVWNRMLKLLDVDSAMEIRTSDVVATVRGTSYGINKLPGCTETVVAESVVSVTTASSTEETLIADNQTGIFGNADCSKPIRKLTSEDVWSAQEKGKDSQFDRDYMKSLRARFDARAKAAGSAPAWIRDASEGMHLAFASGADREQLASAYAKRQLALAVANPADAKKALARMRGLLPAMGQKAGLLRGELHIAATLLARSRYPALRDESARLPFSTKLSGDASLNELRLLRDTVVNNNTIDLRYRELVRIDEGVDDVLAGVNLADARTRIVADLMTRLDAVDTALGNQGDARLKAKSKAIRMRLSSALGIPEMTIPTITPPEEKPIIRIDEPSLQNPVIKSPVTPVPVPVPVQTPVQTPTQTQPVRIYQSLTLTPTPLAPVDGQVVTLKLFGMKSDGQSDDLTSQASFALVRASDGRLQGNLLTPIVVGTIAVSATYRDDIGTRTVLANVVHSVSKQVTAPQSIEIRFVGPTTVTCSSSLPYKVFAIYGSGVSRDVTISSSVTVSDQKLLFPGDGKILTFCAGVQATGIVTALYTEQGITRVTSASITVIPDPATPTVPQTYYY